MIHPDGVALGGNTVSGQTDGWWFDSSEASAAANRPYLTVTYAVAPTNVSAGGPYTIAEGSSLALAASATGTGTLTYSWDVNGDSVFGDAVGSSPTLNWAQLVGLGITDGYTTRNVAVRVSDTYGHQVDSATTLLTINNAPPTASAGGPYAVSEGQSLILSGNGSDPAGAVDPLTYSWDVNGDNVFGDATGASPTLTWAQLVALSITDGTGGSYTVKLQVDDGDGGITTSSAVTLTVNNAAPAAGVSGPASLARDASGNFTFTSTDPAAPDQSAGFTFTIDWNGDGSDVQVVNGASGLIVAHAFATVGARTVKVTATDKDGGISSQATHAVSVSAVQVVSGDLVWTGSADDDGVQFEQLSGTTIRVTTTLDNGLAVNFVETINGVTGIVNASGLAGDDTLDGNWTDGGEGGGRNILVGGADADTLYDYKATDGPEGNGSILIADGTSLSVSELGQVMSEWASTHSYNDRLANILGPGSISRLNGSAYLQPGATVTADAAVDHLWGSTGGTVFNWFWYTLAIDEINRAKAGETQTTL